MDLGYHSVPAETGSRKGWDGAGDEPSNSSITDSKLRLAVGNLCFTVLLSIKNTPLAFLTGYSHERLNVLHRTTGTVTITCSILHWTYDNPYV